MIQQADRELETVLAVARRASDVVKRVYATAFEVEHKAPGDPVTVADREANDLICKALEEAFPGDAVVAEESAPEGAEATLAATRKQRVWFVDPLDGTKEFTTRIGEFAVMIGLAEAGRATLGVVVMPTTGEALVGRVGGAAFLEAGDGSRKPLRVTDVASPSAARLMVSRSHRPAMIEPIITALGIKEVVPCGSVGVKIARVATGQAELYLHGTVGAKRWDSCAPEAVLAAAGGRFTDLGGDPIAYATGDLVLRTGILASNGALYPALLEHTRSALGAGIHPPR